MNFRGISTRGLYLAYKQAERNQFNQRQVHQSSVIGMLNVNGSIYSVGSKGHVIKWNDDLSDPLTVIQTDHIYQSLAISPDHTKLALGTYDGLVQVFDLTTNQLVSYQAHEGEVWNLAFEDLNNLISSGKDRKIIRRNLLDRTDELLVSLGANAFALSKDPHRNRLALGLENGELQALDLSSLKLSNFGGRPGDLVSVIRFNHTGDAFAVGYESGTIQLWNPENFEVIETLPGHTAYVADLKFNQSDQFLISGGYDRKNLIWNLDAVKESPIIISDHDSFVRSVAWTNQQNELITGGTEWSSEKLQNCI